MAEAKNTFLKSKMNKDLDDRILPNGEYRDALNISVGRSEDNDVGSLENIKGNSLIAGTAQSNSSLVCIGKFEDEVNNRIFQILTDYNDPTTNCTSITYPTDSQVVEMKITVYDFNTGNYDTLIEGKFLNFAKNKCWQITGINLVEDLLFWTDNRNQPRKINVTTALGDANYYKEEHQISVAKYMPQLAPQLYKEVDAVVTTVSSPTVIRLNTVVGISVGMTVVSNAKDNVASQTILGSEFIKVTAIDAATATVTINAQPAITIVVGQAIRFLETTMTDESGDSSWPGDPSYLEDKYVRFAYRFQYDDGEYSLMSPFTQIAFIPQHFGFFLNGDENEAYESSVIKWFENNVNNIKLRISMPDVGSVVGSGGSTSKNILTEYKIRNIDILYKESNGLVVKVLKTITGTTMASEMVDNIYVYEYQSEKPYKTLTEGQTTRVFDKVPVRALSQEIAGNRVIYGNFRDKHTPYETLDYNCTVQKKLDLYSSFVEYPNSTLKQNRTYQIGWVLADKFGRQSSVILSEYDTTSTSGGATLFGGSTVFHPYYDENDSLDVKTWFGDAALVLLNQTIGNFTIGQTDRNLATGAPGLYGEPRASWVVADGNNDAIQYDSTALDWKLKFSTPVTGTLPTTDDYLRGEFVDYTKITSISSAGGITTITTLDRPNSYYLYLLENTDEDTKYAYSINPLGWYSYKIVVKQREQDYYNAYLPGFLDGYPDEMTQGSQVNYVVDSASNASYAELENGINQILFPGGELNNTAHSVLLNDNINKIPRDLSEVGPDQKQYRSSVELYGRVNNVAEKFSITGFSWIGSPGGVDSSNQITFPGPNNPTTNPSVFCPTSTCTGKEQPLEAGMALLMAKCEFNGGSEQVCSRPLPGLPDQYYQYPERFSNATVITSVSYDSTTNITTVNYSPGGAINSGTNNLIIEYGDNVQYYPANKADIASTIGTADDLGFYQYSVDNFNGSAARNFYQLETNPIVARFSTNKKLGAMPEDMVPWLSIYETAPVDSLLDIFWESTTGWNYISDINQDVEAGSDNPTGFSSLGFKFKENQNFDGSDNLILTGVTGDADSPWITDIFYPINNTGVNLTTTTSTMTVVNGAGTNVSGSFELQQVPTTSVDEPGGYRIKFINTNHVFLNSAESVENFTFTLAITYNSVVTSRSFNGRLQNIVPSFSLANCSDYTTVVGQTSTDTVIDFNGVNGTTLTASEENDLEWSITNGNANSYFIINSVTGVLTLSQVLGTPPGNELVPLGVYTLTVQVKDAVNAGVALTSSADPNFNSKTATCQVIITVGPDMIPEHYQGLFVSQGIWAQEPRTTAAGVCSSTPNVPSGCTVLNGVSGCSNMIGGYYLGPRQNGFSNPDLYQSQAPDGGTVTYDNASLIGNVHTSLSAIETLSGSTVSNSTPVAFDSGMLLLQVEIENQLTCTNCQGQANFATVTTWDIYHRAASATTPNPNPWVLVQDGNNGDGPDYNFTVSSQDRLASNVTYGAPQTTTNNGATSAYRIIDGDKLPGEYFIKLHVERNSTNSQSCFCGCDNGGVQSDYQGYVTLYSEDANFGPYTAANQAPLFNYPYIVQKLGGTASAADSITTPLTSGSSTQTVYAHAKYGISVRQFFLDSNLLTPWEPDAGSSGGYHSFNGGYRVDRLCANTTQCNPGGVFNPTWGYYINTSSTWNLTTGVTPEPFNMTVPTTPIFRGKWNTEGTLVAGYALPSGSSYGTAGDLIDVTVLVQDYDGGNNVSSTPVSFPMSRTATFL